MAAAGQAPTQAQGWCCCHSHCPAPLLPLSNTLPVPCIASATPMPPLPAASVLPNTFTPTKTMNCCILPPDFLPLPPSAVAVLMLAALAPALSLCHGHHYHNAPVGLDRRSQCPCALCSGWSQSWTSDKRVNSSRGKAGNRVGQAEEVVWGANPRRHRHYGGALWRCKGSKWQGGRHGGGECRQWGGQTMREGGRQEWAKCGGTRDRGQVA